MQRKPEIQAPQAQAAPARKGKGRRVVHTIAQSTLFVAGLAATRFGVAEIDPRCPLFDRTLVDRLQAPITRYHE